MEEEAIISLRRFGGMITNPQKEDIPDEASIYALNVDPQTEIGVLRGIKEKGTSYTANGSTIPDAYEADWIKYDDAGIIKRDLIYIDTNGDKVTAIEDFYNGTEASRTKTDLITSGISLRCIKSFNNQVQIGNGTSYKAKMVYRLLDDKYYFDDQEVATAGLLVENGECYVSGEGNGGFKVTSAVLSGSGGYYQEGKLYRWATSLVYDGLQESNLIEGADDVVAVGGENLATLVITSYGTHTGGGTIDNLDTRVTAVKLYRAESSDDNPANLGLYRLVATIDINGGYHRDDLSGTADAAVTTNATWLQDTRLSLPTNAYVGSVITCNGKTLTVTSNNSNTFFGASWTGSIPGNGFAWTCDVSNDWASSGDDYILTYYDGGSYPDGGATYEENTGISETLEFQSVRYSIEEVGGGYHWVTGGIPEGETGDWQRYLFRSKKFRPNMFDWTKEFLILPELPTALAWYNDRLYVFSENAVYRINPELMYVEDTFFGAGAGHRQSVCVSEYGLYFCNVNGAYLIKDSGIITISDPVSEVLRTEGSSYPYSGFKVLANISYNTASLARMIIKAETDRRLILFLGATSGNLTFAFGYYIPTGQWYVYSIGSTAVNADSGYFNGKDGEIYISNGTASYRLFAATTFESTVWISKEFTLEEPSQNKSWKMIKWDATAGTGTVTVKYATEGSDPTSGISATSGNYINIYKKTFQLYLSTIGNAVIDSIDVIVRRLFGKR